MRNFLLVMQALLIASLSVAQNQNPTQNVCQGVTENYFVDNTVGSSYAWNINPAAGGTIVSGSGTNSINIQWTGAPGDYVVSVVETDANGCVGPTRSVTVTVDETPTPVITGPATACTGTSEVYSVTGTASSSYSWTVTAQGSVASGGNTNSATINWTTAGAATVSITETIGSCSASTTYSVTVNTTPSPSITGPSATCLNSDGVFDVTNNAGSTYTWSVSSGASISAGQGTFQVSVTFNAVGVQTVTIQETANGCTGSDTKNVTVNPIPNTSNIWHN